MLHLGVAFKSVPFKSNDRLRVSADLRATTDMTRYI